MIKLYFLVLFYFTFPFVIIYLCRKWTILQKLGSIVLAYGFGLLIGTMGVLPKGSDGYKFALQGKASIPKTQIETLISSGKAIPGRWWVNQIASIQDLIPTIVVRLLSACCFFHLISEGG